MAASLGMVGPIVGAVIGFLLLIFLFTRVYRTCPPDKLMIVSGLGQMRTVSGRATYVVPLLQRADYLSLGAVQAQLDTDTLIPTKDAILLEVHAVANFQISVAPGLVDQAARNYLNQDKDTIMSDVREVLMGKMREIIGQTDLMDLMRNRDAFNDNVFKSSEDDMARLGLELVTFNVQDFSDQEGVIKAMGAQQSAQITKEAELARIAADSEVADRQNDLDLRRAALKKQADAARAEADLVYKTQTATHTRELNVAEQEAEIAAEQKRIELAERRVSVKEHELEANVKKQADADRYKAEQEAQAALFVAKQQADAKLYALGNDAQATKVAAEAEAEAMEVRAKADASRILQIGEANGAAARAEGEGEARGIEAKAEAYNGMQNPYALVEAYIAALPAVMASVAQPLSNIDSLTMYGEGNGAALARETTNTVDQLNHSLSQTLGFDLSDVMAGLATGTAAGVASARTQAETLPAGGTSAKHVAKSDQNAKQEGPQAE